MTVDAIRAIKDALVVAVSDGKCSVNSARAILSALNALDIKFGECA